MCMVVAFPPIYVMPNAMPISAAICVSGSSVGCLIFLVVMAGSGASTLTAALSQAVSLLHRTIIDTYSLFFLHFDKPVAALSTTTASTGASSSSGGGRGHGSGAVGNAAVLPGLYGRCVQQFLESIITDSDRGKLPKEWMSKRRELLQRIFPESSLLATWKEWIGIWTEQVQDACVSAFSHMKSATEIAHIQRSTLHACMECHHGNYSSVALDIAMADHSGKIPGTISSLTMSSASSAPHTPNTLSGTGSGREALTERAQYATLLWNNSCSYLLPSSILATAAAGAGDERKSSCGMSASLATHFKELYQGHWKE